MSDKGPNELWANIIYWYGAKVGKPLNETDGVWRGTADKLGDFGPFDVVINGHKETVEDFAPFQVRVTSPVYVFACICDPNGGVVTAGDNGETEARLIKFFEAHTALLTQSEPA